MKLFQIDKLIIGCQNGSLNRFQDRSLIEALGKINAMAGEGKGCMIGFRKIRES